VYVSRVKADKILCIQEDKKMYFFRLFPDLKMLIYFVYRGFLVIVMLRGQDFIYLYIGRYVAIEMPSREFCFGGLRAEGVSKQGEELLRFNYDVRKK